ncbi:hypothetical protein X943_001666 [Babesia divergens]|uniref:Uncharacterized protein n=1 Tax=Babesia divergens TaxID=32595 RepID=A0AAD9LF45_BABDI|nr:hypothetical protein X943_001666 [Babesia divergens]
MSTVKVLPYPVYALATDGRYIVTSGGGGGKEYGIKNRLEFYMVSEVNGRTELDVEASTSDGLNILDCAEYISERKAWLGSMGEGTVFFAYRPGKSIRVFGRVLVAKGKDDPCQMVARLAGSGDFFITGASDGAVRVWRMSARLLEMFDDKESDGASQYLKLGFTDDYAPTEPSSPCVRNDESDSSYNCVSQSDVETELFEGLPTDSEGATTPVSGSNCSTERGSPERMKYPDLERRVAHMLFEYRCHEKQVNDCHLSHDGKFAVSVSSDLLVIYQVDPAGLICKRESSMRFKFCRFLKSPYPNGPYRILTVEWEPKKPSKAVATVWTYADGDDTICIHKSVCVGSTACSALSVRGDNLYFGLGFGNGEVAVYTTDTLKCVLREQRHMLPVTDVAFLRDKLVSGGADFYVIIKTFQGGLLIYIITILVPIFAYLLYLLTHRQY